MWHVATVAASCFCHLFVYVRSTVESELKWPRNSCWRSSRLDYCNSVIVGLPQVTLEPLQRVQNAAARLVLYFNTWDKVTPGLRQLHWLPVRWRIHYRMCTIMHSLVDVQPTLQIVFDRLPTKHLVLNCGQQSRHHLRTKSVICCF